jgi:hypothetical protein
VFRRLAVRAYGNAVAERARPVWNLRRKVFRIAGQGAIRRAGRYRSQSGSQEAPA